MSLLERTGYLALSALFAASLFGCANDDALFADDDSAVNAAGEGDEGNVGGVAEPGRDDVALDRASLDVEEPGVVPDDLSGEFLLSFVVNLFSNADIRFIATVGFTPDGAGGGTADFSFQPLNAAECVGLELAGLPVDVAPFVANDVPINADGTFSIEVVGATLPADANAVLCDDLTGDISVAGTVVDANLICGDLDTILPGTFGAIRIEAGTVGDDNLPDPVTECP